LQTHHTSNSHPSNSRQEQGKTCGEYWPTPIASEVEHESYSTPKAKPPNNTRQKASETTTSANKNHPSRKPNELELYPEE